MSLVARHLEAGEIASVIVGSARDIVEECGVARFVFSDFPLGNPCGKPWDTAMQRSVVETALALLERAWMPRTSVQMPFTWDRDNNGLWRDRYMKVDDASREILEEARRKRRERQRTVKQSP